MSQLDQHLIDSLESLGDTFKEGISEFQLLKILQNEPYNVFDKQALEDNLVMFQTHFVLFNALYTLQDKWISAHKGHLTIFTTKIVLQPITDTSTTVSLTDPVRDYYLDWKNFSETSLADVEQMLDDFWAKMGDIKPQHAILPQMRDEALEAMQFNTLENVTKEDIKKQYRKLQHKYHPDKGGDADKAKTLSWAYSVLIELV